MKDKNSCGLQLGQFTRNITTECEYCLWKEILSKQRIRHFKIVQSIYFAYDAGIISSYSNRMSINTSPEVIENVGLCFSQPKCAVRHAFRTVLSSSSRKASYS